MEPIAQDRLILIHKPLRWTSFDVVHKLRNIFRMKKIGHAGTLDPLATGLLIICTGKMTKQIDTYQGQEKEYTGSFILGKSTPSYDLETEITETGDPFSITPEKIHEAARSFVGVIQQIPPMHSAIKVNGKRAYKIARTGKDAELKPREVTISTFEITNIELPKIDFRVICSKGTYIRSLARDMGQYLGVGAYLSELCRTRIGSFHLNDASTLEDIALAHKRTHENLSRPE